MSEEVRIETKKMKCPECGKTMCFVSEKKDFIKDYVWKLQCISCQCENWIEKDDE